ncbi:hypothetical protein PN466_02115 [Roseofilum reptotaenium CS-1145]|uniref:Uncharacterized protein n=1 Tax=Roseofilum reptotaenium AO1-A TaxID=1925591 RepID=A0A1L9QN70_9CYAN|nr:hypothetical protein [Roseofilum reptotaenium]MDB9515752.1 hypothetical protein [Roseofilum reptotaenium CS-1145]OJJ24092.1 hypothetical protein BI308_18645 [Roseofilum reptotaenium AO1-A]
MDEAKFIHRVEVTQDMEPHPRNYEEQTRMLIREFISAPNTRSFLAMRDALQLFTGQYSTMLDFIEGFELSDNVVEEVSRWRPCFIEFNTIWETLCKSGTKTFQETADLVANLQNPS